MLQGVFHLFDITDLQQVLGTLNELKEGWEVTQQPIGWDVTVRPDTERTIRVFKTIDPTALRDVLGMLKRMGGMRFDTPYDRLGWKARVFMEAPKPAPTPPQPQRVVNRPRRPEVPNEVVLRAQGQVFAVRTNTFRDVVSGALLLGTHTGRSFGEGPGIKSNGARVMGWLRTTTCEPIWGVQDQNRTYLSL